MRQAALAIVLALGFYAAAEEGPLLTPRIRIPDEKGIRPEIVIPDALLDSWKMTEADKTSLRETLKKINDERGKIMGKLKTAKEALQEAGKSYNELLSQLDHQVLQVQDEIGKRIGADQAKEYGIRTELQPYADWLTLTDEQVGKIIEKEKALLANDPRAKIVEAAKAAREAVATGVPSTAEERAKRIELLTEFMKFNKSWLDAIKSELTPAQQKLWDERYRRSQYLIEPPKAEAGK